MEFERTYRAHRRINLTSLIDVTFLLVVFFMLTSSFMRTESLELSFPTGAMQVTANEKPIIIVVADHGRLFLRNKPMKLEEINAAIEAPLKKNSDHRVLVMSTNNVSVQELVHVMDAVYKAGGTNVSVSHWEY